MVSVGVQNTIIKMKKSTSNEVATPPHSLSGSENSDNKNDESDSNEVATPPHGLSGGEHRIMKNPLQMRWQLHLMVSVGVKMQ